MTMIEREGVLDMATDYLAVGLSGLAVGAHVMQLLNPYLIGASATLSILLAGGKLIDRWRRGARAKAGD